MYNEIRRSDIEDIVNSVMGLAKLYNCFCVLEDGREMKLEVLASEIYDLPEAIANMVRNSGFSIHEFKRAFLLKQHHEYISFFETVSLNNAQNTKLFYDFEEAVNWLAKNS
jgi:hypothetical protein